MPTDVPAHCRINVSGIGTNRNSREPREADRETALHPMYDPHIWGKPQWENTLIGMIRLPVLGASTRSARHILKASFRAVWPRSGAQPVFPRGVATDSSCEKIPADRLAPLSVNVFRKRATAALARRRKH
jgi:hypothetical protein